MLRQPDEQRDATSLVKFSGIGKVAGAPSPVQQQEEKEFYSPVLVKNPYFEDNRAADALLTALEYAYDQIETYKLFTRKEALSSALDSSPLAFIFNIAITITDYIQAVTAKTIEMCYAPPFSQLLMPLLNGTQHAMPPKGSIAWQTNELKELKLLLDTVEETKAKLESNREVISKKLDAQKRQSSGYFSPVDINLVSALDYCDAAIRQYVPEYIISLQRQIADKTRALNLAMRSDSSPSCVIC